MARQLPAHWMQEWGCYGPVLADSLPQFSLDVVRIVGQYLLHKTASSHRVCTSQWIDRLLATSQTHWTDFAIDTHGRLWLSHFSTNQIQVAHCEGKQEPQPVSFASHVPQYAEYCSPPLSMAASDQHLLLLREILFDLGVVTWMRLDDHRREHRCEFAFRSISPDHIGPILSCDADGNAYFPTLNATDDDVRIIRLSRQSGNTSETFVFSTGKVIENMVLRVHPRRPELYVYYPGCIDGGCFCLHVLDSITGKHLRILRLRSKARTPVSIDFDRCDNLVLGTKAHVEFYDANGTFLTSHRTLHGFGQDLCQATSCIRPARYGSYKIGTNQPPNTRGRLYCPRHRAPTDHLLEEFCTRDVRVHPDGAVFVLEKLTGSLFVLAFVDKSVEYE